MIRVPQLTIKTKKVSHKNWHVAFRNSYHNNREVSIQACHYRNTFVYLILGVPRVTIERFRLSIRKGSGLKTFTQ